MRKDFKRYVANNQNKSEEQEATTSPSKHNRKAKELWKNCQQPTEILCSKLKNEKKRKINKKPHNFPSLSFKINFHDQSRVWKAQIPCFITVSKSLDWRKGILAIEDEASIKGARGSFHQKFKQSKWNVLWKFCFTEGQTEPGRSKIKQS